MEQIMPFLYVYIEQIGANILFYYFQFDNAHAC
jgi:hypothetical protein